MSVQGKAALCSAAFFSFFLGACAAPAPAERLARVHARGTEAGFVAVAIAAPPFQLFSLQRPGQGQGTLRVYIEGDGPAWPGPYSAPENPTPFKPMALELALSDPEMPVAYLARPCQYLASPVCVTRHWSVDRFSGEIVATYQMALDALKSRTGHTDLSLAGYSGGGVLAALLAASRSDVTELLTVAAPLDTAAWVQHHQLTPLAGANPAELAGRLSKLPQHHWSGERDEVVPVGILRQFAKKQGMPEALTIVPGYDHACCWADDWPRRLAERKSRR